MNVFNSITLILCALSYAGSAIAKDKANINLGDHYCLDRVGNFDIVGFVAKVSKNKIWLQTSSGLKTVNKKKLVSPYECDKKNQLYSFLHKGVYEYEHKSGSTVGPSKQGTESTVYNIILGTLNTEAKNAAETFEARFKSGEHQSLTDIDIYFAHHIMLFHRDKQSTTACTFQNEVDCTTVYFEECYDGPFENKTLSINCKYGRVLSPRVGGLLNQVDANYSIQGIGEDVINSRDGTVSMIQKVKYLVDDNVVFNADSGEPRMLIDSHGMLRNGEKQLKVNDNSFIINQKISKEKGCYIVYFSFDDSITNRKTIDKVCGDKTYTEIKVQTGDVVQFNRYVNNKLKDR